VWAAAGWRPAWRIGFFTLSIERLAPELHSNGLGKRGSPAQGLTRSANASYPGFGSLDRYRPTFCTVGTWLMSRGRFAPGAVVATGVDESRPRPSSGAGAALRRALRRPVVTSNARDHRTGTIQDRVDVIRDVTVDARAGPNQTAKCGHLAHRSLIAVLRGYKSWKIFVVDRLERLGLLEFPQRARECIDQSRRNARLAEADIKSVLDHAAGQ
jgi:hypothetical protein